MWGSVAPQYATQTCICWQEEPLCCDEESEEHDMSVGSRDSGSSKLTRRGVA
jgi:hypothetical protein